MAKSAPGLQDVILNGARKDRIPVTLHLMNGVPLKGLIRGFDAFVVLLESDGKQQMIYKHAISTIAPVRALTLPEIDPEVGTPEREPALR